MGKRWKNKITYVILVSVLAISLAGCGNTEEEREVMAGKGRDIEETAEKNTKEPAVPPTEAPTVAPTEVPTAAPTEAPTPEPTVAPTPEPTEAPPTEEEINGFLASHYEELEHEMTLSLWKTKKVVPYKILSGVKWVSQDESVAVVQDGVVFALQPGKTLLTAKAGNYELYCNVEVTGYEDMKLAVNGSVILPVNDKIGSLRLETENPEMLEVTDNKLTAKAAGRCKVTAYVNEEPYTFYVVMTDPQISQTALTKIVGTQEKLYVFGTPSTVVWTSDNEAIATVSADGVVTAASRGINQTTTIRAQVDGVELSCQVTVEAIPQLSTSYRIYGYFTDTDENGEEVEDDIVLYANTNEIITSNNNTKSVMSMSSVSFDKNTFPVYYAYGNEAVSQGTIAGGRCAHTQIYLLGTSRDAHVMVKNAGGREVSGGTTATYTPMDGFGIIDVYIDLTLINLKGEIEEEGTENENTRLELDREYKFKVSKESVYTSNKEMVTRSFTDQVVEGSLKCGDSFAYGPATVNWGTFYRVADLSKDDYKIVSYHCDEERKVTGTVFCKDEDAAVRVYVEVEGFTYQMYVTAWDLGVYNPSVEIPSKFYIDDDAINADKYDTQIAQSGGSSGQVQRAGSNSSFKSNSDSFISGDWVDKMKGKFIDAVEDQAIDMAVSLLFKLIFF